MPITGKQREELTFENILTKIDEYSLYRWYLGMDFKLNKAFKNPFRGDKHPSMSVMCTRGGFLYHRDWACDFYKGTLPDLVKQIYGCTYGEALLKIDKDMGLGFRSGNGRDFKKTIEEYKKPIIAEKRASIIQVKAGKWTEKHWDFWRKFNIMPEDVKASTDPKIYIPKEIFLNKSLYIIPKDEIAFGYLFKDRHWKIYRPYAKDKKDKWISNVPIDTMYGLENIKDCEKAIVTKSVKDYLLIRRMFPCVCGVQNESNVAINQENIQYLKAHVKDVYINFDGDPVGKKHSLFYTEEYGWKHINVPDYYVKAGIKDFSDLAMSVGMEAVEKHFKTKKLL